MGYREYKYLAVKCFGLDEKGVANLGREVGSVKD